MYRKYTKPLKIYKRCQILNCLEFNNYWFLLHKNDIHRRISMKIFPLEVFDYFGVSWYSFFTFVITITLVQISLNLVTQMVKVYAVLRRSESFLYISDSFWAASLINERTTSLILWNSFWEEENWTGISCIWMKSTKTSGHVMLQGREISILNGLKSIILKCNPKKPFDHKISLHYFENVKKKLAILLEFYLETSDLFSS